MNYLSRVLPLIAVLVLTACGRPDLARSDAESMLTKSEQVSSLSKRIAVAPDAIDQGRSQGLWDVQRNGQVLLRAKAAEEIASISGRYAVPKSSPSIKVEVTGIADSPASEKIKEVQFNWAYVSLTPVMRRFALEGGTGKALFREFDDGWRMEGVQTKLSDRPIELTAAEKSQIDQDVASERAQQQEIQNFVASSWTPSRKVREFSFSPAVDPARSAKYGAMKVVITDVDVSYGAESGLQTVWFGHVREIGVTQRGQVYLNNRNLVGGYIYEHPEMNSQEVAQVLQAAVNEWRLKYRDQLPSDVHDRYLAAKKRRN